MVVVTAVFRLLPSFCTLIVVIVLYFVASVVLCFVNGHGVLLMASIETNLAVANKIRCE